MKTRSIPYPVSSLPGPGARSPVPRHCGPREPAPAQQEILLVSNDVTFGERLKGAATRSSRLVVQVDNAVDALQAVEATQPAVVLLDLDLPSESAWQAADRLLLEEDCPPLVLLTARSGQFDVNSAVRAGSLVDKSTDASRLIDIVDQAVAPSYAARIERNAIQRVMIRWLKPSSWSVPVTPAHRFWGINE